MAHHLYMSENIIRIFKFVILVGRWVNYDGRDIHLHIRIPRPVFSVIVSVTIPQCHTLDDHISQMIYIDHISVLRRS